MESAHHFSSKSDCDTMQQMSIPEFCVPLSQQSHLSRIDGVLTYNDSMTILHRLCQIPTTELPNLVPQYRWWFTSFTKIFVICGCQITKIFRFGHDCTSTSSARSPCHFGSQADFAISVFGKVGFNNVLPRYQFSTTVRIWILRSVCECWHMCIFEFVCDLLQPLWEVSQAIFLCLSVIFISAFWIIASISRRLFVTSFLEQLLVESCLTTILEQQTRNFSSYIELSFLVWSIVAFDRWPTDWSILGLRKAWLPMGQQAFPRVIARLRTDSSHERTLVPPRVCTSPVAVNNTERVLDLFTVSTSSELNYFLLIMCIDAFESTANSRSSGLVEVGAGIFFASIGEKSVVVSEFWSL